MRPAHEARPRPRRGPFGPPRRRHPRDVLAGGIDRLLLAARVRHLDPASLPAFLGIGAPQSGTRWLYENLRRHPGLYLPRRKEIHYFDRQFHRGPSWYAHWFRDHGGRLPGEITPSYGALARARIRHVRRLLPEVRLLYVLRNPVDRAWSRARRRHARGWGPAGPLDLAYLKACEADPSIQPGAYEPGLGKGDHARILAHWLEVFPRERLKLVFFEEIATAPRALLGEVFQHLGVPACVDWSRLPLHEVVNRNPPAPLPDDCRSWLEERYRDGIEALRPQLDAADRSRLGAWSAPPAAHSAGSSVQATRRSGA